MKRLLCVLACVIAVASVTAGAWRSLQEAEISGTVVTLGEPRSPIARVIVTLSGGTLRAGRTVISDERGRFTFSNLAAGSYIVVAMRPPFVKTAFGAKRPGRPGTPVSLAAGQRFTEATIPLARGAAITGAIRTNDGDVAPGVRVEVTALDAQAELPQRFAVTDDRGVYRVFGLTPGKYIVAATSTDPASAQLSRFSDAEMDAILANLARRSPGPGRVGAPPASPDAGKRPVRYGVAPIYFPGSADPELADVISLTEAEERSGVDIGLQLVRVANVEGRVSVSGGTLPTNIQVTMTRLGERSRESNRMISGVNSRQADPSGVVRFTNVLPGRYRLVVRAFNTAAVVGATGTYSMSDALWAMSDITVDGEDIGPLSLALQPGLRVSGRISFDRQALAPPANLTTVRLRLVDVTGSTTFVPPPTTHPDGTFDVGGLMPSTYDMTATTADAGWWLRSVMAGGRDLLDFPLELGMSGDVSGIVAIFSDRHTELAGTLQTTANTPATDYFVVVISRDRAFWRLGSRRIQFTRPGTDGRFAFRNLPAGDYVLAGLADLEPGELVDASFLDLLVQSGVPIKLGEGEKQIQNLRVLR